MPNKQKTILSVEDDQFLSSLIKAKLTRDGYTVEQASNGEEALEKLKTVKPGLILLDLVMPKMPGFEFLEAISVDPELAKIPIVVLSNLGQDSDVEKAKRFGVSQYFIKTQTSVDQLSMIVHNIIGAPEPAEEPAQVAA